MRRVPILERAWRLCALASMMFLGCQGGPPVEPASAELCVRDPALIAMHLECARSDNCPCGTHCELGQCVASCNSDADCGAVHCDALGFCAGMRPAPVAEGELVLDNAALDFATPDEVRTLRLHARSAAIDTVRVVAPDMIEVSCDQGTSWGAECTTSVPETTGALQEALVQFRTQGGAPLLEPAIARVYWAGESTSVALSTQLVAFDDGTLGGVYGGTASVVSAPNAAASVTQSVPIQITANVPVGSSSGFLSIHDPSRLVHPSGTWTAPLGVDPSDPTKWLVDFPRTAAFDGTATASAPISARINADPVSFALTSVRSVDTIDFLLTVHYTGVQPAPTVTWHLTASRAPNATPATLMAVPDVADPPAPSADTLFAWEQAVDDSLDALPSDPATASARLIGLAGPGTPPALGVDACGRGQGVLNAATANEFSGQAPATAIGGTLVSLAADTSAPLIVRHVAAVLRDGWTGGIAVPVEQVEVISTPSLTDDALPCAVGAARGDTMLCDVMPATLDFGSFDQCESLSMRYGCTVEPSAGGSIAMAITQRIGSSSCPSTVTMVTAPITSVCRWHTLATRCAELATCAEPSAADTTNATLASSLFGTALSGGTGSVSGDLACGARTDGTLPNRSAALDLEYGSDLGQVRPRSTIVEACIAELRAARMGPVPAASGGGAGLSAILGSPACIGVPRLLYALGHASSVDRARASNPADAEDYPASRLALRLIQEWLSVHALVANDAAGSVALHEVLGGTTGTPEERLGRTIAALDDALSTSTGGWDLLLHPRVGSMFEGLPEAALIAPDYRADYGASIPSDLVTDQPIGLPVAMLETLQGQLELLDELLRQAQLRGDQEVSAGGGALLARVPVVRALADTLAARATASGQPVAWAARYSAASASLSAALDRIAQRVTAMNRGDNPLGIAESDVPFVFGDAPAMDMPAARFSAVSTYILDNQVMRSLGSATQSFTSAQTAYASFLDSQYQQRLAATAAQARFDTVVSQHADELTTYCGAPSGVSGAALFDPASWGLQGFDPARCDVRDEDPSCQVDESAFWSSISDDDVRYQICVRQHIAQSGTVGQFLLFGGNRPTPEQQAVFLNPDCDPQDVLVTRVQGRVLAVQCLGRDFVIDEQGNRTGPVPPATYQALLASAETACRVPFPNARTTAPSSDTIAPALALASCYRGSLGSLAMDLRGAAIDVATAAADYDAVLEGYGIALSSCEIQAAADEQIADLRDRIGQAQQRERTAHLTCGVIKSVATAVRDCAAVQTHAAATLFGFPAASVACFASGAIAAAEITELSIDFDADNEIAYAQSMIQQIQDQTASQRCYNDARQQLVGLQSAQLRLQRAGQDMQAAMLAFQNAQGAAQRAFDAGRAAVTAAQGRTAAPPGHDGWLDSDVAAFNHDMARARRATYLAVRASEQELQMTLGTQRTAVLQAQSPADLDAVVTALRDAASVPGIGGHRPESFKVVASLADQVLWLRSDTGSPNGWNTPSTPERVAQLLGDAYNAARRRGDTSLQIRFQLSPVSGALDPQGVAAFTLATCAERLWSVNAVLLGTSHLILGSDASFVPITISQHNQFHSMRCDSPTMELDASYSGAERLFREPGDGIPVVVNAGQEYTPAAVDAAINVPRAELERDDYTNGASSQLAARGLYSEYVLAIPLSQIAVPGSTGPGLDLSAVTDILVRFDYVAVSR